MGASISASWKSCDARSWMVRPEAMCLEVPLIEPLIEPIEASLLL